MDLNYSPEETEFRDEVRAWLGESLPRDLRDKVVNYQALGKDDLLRWHRILARKGMGMSEELKVSHTFRRLTMIGQTFGDAEHHLERFAASGGHALPS